MGFSPTYHQPLLQMVTVTRLHVLLDELHLLGEVGREVVQVDDALGVRLLEETIKSHLLVRDCHLLAPLVTELWLLD